MGGRAVARYPLMTRRCHAWVTRIFVRVKVRVRPVGEDGYESSSRWFDCWCVGDSGVGCGGAAVDAAARRGDGGGGGVCAEYCAGDDEPGQGEGAGGGGVWNCGKAAERWMDGGEW